MSLSHSQNDLLMYTPSSTDEILENEYEAMELELLHLLQHNVPEDWRHVMDIMKEVAQYLSTTPPGAAKSKHDTCKDEVFSNADLLKGTAEDFSYESDAVSLKGTVTVVGFNIMSAYFTIRLAKYNRGHPLQTRIANSSPWILPQPQAAHHLTRLAYQKLCSEDFTTPSVPPTPSSTASPFHSPGARPPSRARSRAARMVRVIEEVMALLQQSKEELTLPPTELFWEKSSFPKTPLVPSLPPDLFLDVSVRDGDLILSVFGIAITSIINYPSPGASVASAGGGVAVVAQKGAMAMSAAAAASGGTSKKDKKRRAATGAGSLVGQNFQTKHLSGYIAEHVDVVCPVPSYKKAVASLSIAYQHCVSIRDKLLVHLSVN